MSKAKAKGTAFETAVVRYLKETIGGDVERRTLSGSNDRGDVQGVFLGDERVVIECKAHRELKLSEWLKEADREAENDGAAFGIVVAKRRGFGESRMGEQYAVMKLETLARLLASSSRRS